MAHTITVNGSAIFSSIYVQLCCDFCLHFYLFCLFLHIQVWHGWLELNFTDIYWATKGWNVCFPWHTCWDFLILLLPHLACVFWSHNTPSPSCWEPHWYCLWKYDWFSVGGGQCTAQQLLLWLSTVGASVGVDISDKAWLLQTGPLVSRRSIRGPQ